MPSYTYQNTVNYKKNLSRYLQFLHVTQIIDQIPSSIQRPILISSLPERYWILENSIIDYIRGKNVYVKFLCFETDLNVFEETRKGIPVDGKNFDITLNGGTNEKWDRYFVYLNSSIYTDSVAAYINLGDFCGLTVSNLEDFTDTVNYVIDGTPIYNYINILTTGRGTGDKIKELFKDYNVFDYADKYTYIHQKIEERILNCGIREVMYYPYRNNKSNLLSLSYAINMPFLERLDESKTIDEINDPLFDIIKDNNPVVETANFSNFSIIAA